jgi:Fe2+ transport system protein FeoA
MQTNTPSAHKATRKAVPLTQLVRGQRGRIDCTDAESDDCSVLRAMGLRPDASIQMCRLGEPCIISLTGACGGGCRIGLAKGIASRVMVHIDE